MPYSTPLIYGVGERLLIEFDIPERGELSQTGRAENLVIPEWIPYKDERDQLSIKLVVCRSVRRNYAPRWRPRLSDR